MSKNKNRGGTIFAGFIGIFLIGNTFFGNRQNKDLLALYEDTKNQGTKFAFVLHEVRTVDPINIRQWFQPILERFSIAMPDPNYATNHMVHVTSVNGDNGAENLSFAYQVSCTEGNTSIMMFEPDGEGDLPRNIFGEPLFEQDGYGYVNYDVPWFTEMLSDDLAKICRHNLPSLILNVRAKLKASTQPSAELGR